MNVDKIDVLIERFVTDPDVQLGNSYGQQRNIFKIIGANENNNSNLLAWLFNPREAHGLSDLFVREMFRNVFLVYESIDKGYKKSLSNENQFYKDFNARILDGLNFNSLIVEREFSIKDGKRIDICLIDHENEFIVFLENKIETTLSGDDQLHNYYQWLNDNFEDYYGLYIYLDYNENFNINDKSYDHWIGLGYGWIEEFLHRIIDRDILPIHINFILKDYYQYLNDDELISELSKDVNDDIFSVLSNRHHDLFEKLRMFELRIGDQNKKMMSLTSRDILEGINGKYITVKQLKIINIYWKYHHIFEKSLEYTKNDCYKKELLSRLPGYDLDFEFKKHEISVFNNTWTQFQLDLDGYWGMYVFLDISSEDNLVADLKVGVKARNIKEEYLDIFFKLVKIFGYNGSELGSREVLVTIDTKIKQNKWINSIVSVFKRVDHEMNKLQYMKSAEL